MKTKTTLMLEKEVVDELKERLSNEDGGSLSSLVRMLLRDQLKKMKKVSNV